MASSTATARASDSDPEEPGQPADRELIELLNELRVALPGVQVLFAFLLGIRFTQRYAQLDVSDRRVFFREMYVPRHAASGRGHGTGRGFGGWFVLP